MPVISNYLKLNSMFNQTAVREQPKFRLGGLPAVIFLLGLASLFSYLIVVNRTNTMGYEIAEMQLKVKQLEKEQRDLTALSTELQAMPRIQEISSAQLNMVRADNFSYLDSVKTSVAVSR